MTPYRKVELMTLHPISHNSDLARWILSQDWFEFSMEEALADFGYQLRMGKN